MSFCVHWCVSVCVSVSVSVCPSVRLSVLVSVFLSACVHNTSKNNGLIHLKLEPIVVCENISDDIRHCPIKVKVTA